MSTFEALADFRWRRGVNEIRGGDERKPFDGDPIDEGMEECLDIRNYAQEAVRQGRLSPELGRFICGLAAFAFALFRRHMKRDPESRGDG